MDEASGNDGLITLSSSPPHLRFSPSKLKDCTTCKHDPTYEEMIKGIVCKATVDCVDEKQWKKKKYKVYKTKSIKQEK